MHVVYWHPVFMYMSRKTARQDPTSGHVKINTQIPIVCLCPQSRRTRSHLMPLLHLRYALLKYDSLWRRIDLLKRNNGVCPTSSSCTAEMKEACPQTLAREMNSTGGPLRVIGVSDRKMVMCKRSKRLICAPHIAVTNPAILLSGIHVRQSIETLYA